MSNIRYYNESAPFWDFVGSFEDGRRGQPGQHPFANSGPFQGWNPRGWGPVPHHNHPGYDGTAPGNEDQNPPTYTDAESNEAPTPSTLDAEKNTGEASNSKNDNEKGAEDKPDGSKPHHGHGPHGRRGGCWSRGRSGMGCGNSGPRPGHHGPSEFFHRGRGWRGGCGPRSFMGGRPGFAGLADFVTSQMFGGERRGGAGGEYANESGEDYTPPVDVFDTENAFIVHVSLAGAKKEDVAVNWEPEKSELVIAGVLHRPGDEELLKTLAMGERAVGAFERRVRLGSPARPARVEVDEISARLEDGILRVEIPKEDRDFVEIKGVDVE